MNSGEHGSRRKFAVVILFCAAAMGLGACQSSGYRPSEDSPPLATIRRAGGLLFNDDEVTVYSDGGFVIKHLSGKRAGSTAGDKLPPDTFKNLKNGLEATINFPTAYPRPRGFDAYEYSLVYKGRTTTWSDASVRVPDELVQIGSLFNSAFLIAAERERAAQEGN